jgi:hypothetical protein
MAQSRFVVLRLTNIILIKNKKNTTIPKAIIFTLILFLGFITASTSQTFEYKTTGTNFILYDVSIPEG